MARRQIYTLLAIVVLTVIMLVNERGLLPEEQRAFFVVAKGIPILGFLFAALFVWWRPGDRLVNWMYAISGIAYDLVSSLYRPSYALSLFQVLVLFPFIFPHSASFYWSFMIVAMTAFTASFVYRWPDVPENSFRLTLVDWVNFSFQLAVILALIYVFFVRVRRERQKSEAQLLQLGKQSARISHDLKNMMAAPQIHLEHLEQALREHAELRPAVVAIRTQMSTLQTALAELARLAVPGGLPESAFALRESIQGAAIALGSSLRSISVEIEGEHDCVADRSVVSPIVHNLMANAIAAINRTKPAERWIRWTLGPKVVTCEDSGGGFSAAALDHARRGISHSDFTDGSGLGLEIVRDNVQRLGCTIEFGNGPRGARVVWRW